MKGNRNIGLVSFFICLSFCACSGNIPQGVRTSDEYAVTVKVGNSLRRDVPAVSALTADGTGNRHRLPDEIYSEFDGIKKANKVASCAVASVVSDGPADFEVMFKKAGQTCTASLQPGEKRIICPDGDPIHCVVLSVEEKHGLDTEGYPNRMVFGRGYHTVANNAFISRDSLNAPIVNVPDSTVVILGEDAHVCASFNIEGARHVKICGNGYINQLERCAGKDCVSGADSLGGFRKGAVPSIYIHRGSCDVSVEGIKIISDFRGICGRSSRDIDIRDVVIMTSAANGDGINFSNCTGCSIESSLIHSEDDCLALFNNRDSISNLWDEGFEWPAVCSGITMRGCTLWTACRPFCIGGHGTGVRSLTENIVENVTVEHCHIAGQPNEINADWSEKTIKRRTFWSGAFRILSQSNQTVRNIVFRDIDYNWTPGYNGQPVHICVRDNSRTSYSETGGYRIENVLFENISFTGCNPQRLPVYVKAPSGDDGSGISGLVFRNVSFDGAGLGDGWLHVEGNVDMEPSMQMIAAPDSITVDVRTVLGNIPPYYSGSCLEDVNHEIYGGLFGQRLYGESFEEPAPEDGPQISRQWQEYAAGDAEREFRLMTDEPYNGKQYQRISASGGRSSRSGVWNMGLNGWGIPVLASKPMTGYVCLRSDTPVRAFVALQSSDGSRTYCSKRIRGISSEWKRFDFSLKPSCSDSLSRFCIYIEGPGTLDADISCLYEHRSKWCGAYPLRKDIADAMVDEGLTVLRYGGSMVNSPGYRTDIMLQPPHRRPSYSQVWNEYGSHGFAIEEFMQLCEYCGFLPAVAVPAQDNPEDVAKLIEYLNAPADNPLGRLRERRGHPEPYGLKWVEIGNEEAIHAKEEDIPAEYDLYIERFNAIYDAVRKVDTSVVFICSAWWRQRLPAQMEKIFRALDGKASMWDYHPYADALDCNVKAEDRISNMERFFHQWNPDTKMKCVIFEENGDTHHMKRALGHALIQNVVRRHGDFVTACCAANALQPWHQDDTHWDQGQIFFTPTRVWHMPPSYVTRMLSDAWQPLLLASGCSAPLDVVCTADRERGCLTLLVVNTSEKPVTAAIRIKGGGEYHGFKMKTITGQLDDENTPDNPERIVPVEVTASDLPTFPAYSFSVMQIFK